MLSWFRRKPQSEVEADLRQQLDAAKREIDVLTIERDLLVEVIERDRMRIAAERSAYAARAAIAETKPHESS